MTPINAFNPMEQLNEALGSEDLIEGRFENDANGNPIYVGYTPVPNGDPASPIWFIQKIEYTASAIVRKRLPDSGRQFTYIWNNRASYFS